MPTYDYECGACGHTCEMFQSIMDAPRRKCPECGKRTLKRLIGRGAGVIFKGSGFYETDYRSESYKKKAKADSASTDGDKPASSGAAADSSGNGAAKKTAAESKTTAGGSSPSSGDDKKS